MLAVAGASATASAERRDLSFRDALAAALARNGDIMLAKADIDIAATDIGIARGAFDHLLIANGRWWKNDTPSSRTGFDSQDSGLDGSLEFTGRITTGTSYSVALTTISDKFISPFATIYNPAYTSTATLTVTQPLMRGGWRSANRAPIVVASLRRDLSEQQLRVRLEQIIGQVEVAYWTLALAHREREARESSVKLSKDQLSESQRLVRLGTISDLDVLEAKAGLGRSEQQLIRARQGVADAEGKLYLVIIGESGKGTGADLLPVDPPELVKTSYSIEEHIELARKNRPDVAAARAQLTAEQAGLGVTANELKPQVDLILSGGLLGFAGELTELGENTVASSDPPFTNDPDQNGGFGRALANMASAKNYTVSVALKIELPLENTAAKARHAKQRHTVTRAKIAQQSVLDRVDNEVRTSLALLQQDEALQKAADEAVVTNEKLLVGMRKRFAAGAVTSFDVLRVADELTRAQIEAARARVSYRISLARLAVADGTLLQRHQVDISAVRKK